MQTVVQRVLFRTVLPFGHLYPPTIILYKSTYCHCQTVNSALLIAKFTLLQAQNKAAKSMGLNLWFLNSNTIRFNFTLETVLITLPFHSKYIQYLVLFICLFIYLL